MSGPAVAPVPGVAEDADKFCIRQRLGKLKVPGPEQVAAAFFSVNGIQFRTHRLCQPFGQFDPISEGRAAQHVRAEPDGAASIQHGPVGDAGAEQHCGRELSQALEKLQQVVNLCGFIGFSLVMPQDRGERERQGLRPRHDPLPRALVHP